MNQTGPLIEAAKLPFLTSDLPGIGGDLKGIPADFVVEEIPAYQPCGDGEHLFLWIEKQDTSAEQLVNYIAQSVGIRREDIGVAGLKDRRAVTRQFVSVPLAVEDRVLSMNCETIRVLEQIRHTNKLRTGHLRGNRFLILVRKPLSDSESRAKQILDRIAECGFPNYFGEQRFGIAGTTLRTGLDLLSGKSNQRRLPRSRRKFLMRLSLSAVQSDLFNQVLAERITDGLTQRVLPGDVMQVVESGGCFVVEDLDYEQQRFEKRETVLTGPMFGPKMKRPRDEPEARELRALERNGLAIEDFARFKKLTSGTRRPMLVHPADLEFVEEASALRFSFTLPRGAYATVLMREFMKVTAPDQNQQL